MDWLQVCIYTTTEGIETVSAKLMELGISGIEIEDEKDFKNFLKNNRQYWDYVDDDLIRAKEGETCIKTYVEEDDSDTLQNIKTAMAELKMQDNDGILGRLEILLNHLKEEDWSNTWKNYFHTMEIGDSLIVKPYWEEIEKTDKKVFEINPGLTFGTGSHHTTKLCLLDIQKYVKDGDTVLDLGCGSGILSIVSLMYGAKCATAVDIDENSLETAYDNLSRNGISKDRYNVLIGNILSDKALQNKISSEKYDVILANIVADVIISALPVVKASLKPGGVFITSGIIEDRIDDVKNALLNAGFKIVSENRSADWAEFNCTI